MYNEKPGITIPHTQVTSKAIKNNMAYLVYAQAAELASVAIDLRCETESTSALPALG
jgi:hypothetical protein